MGSPAHAQASFVSSHTIANRCSGVVEADRSGLSSEGDTTRMGQSARGLRAMLSNLGRSGDGYSSPRFVPLTSQATQTKNGPMLPRLIPPQRRTLPRSSPTTAKLE